MITANSLKGYFPEVRSFEAFKFLHLGMVSEIKHKSLPAIAKAVGLDNSQSLHRFLSESPWVTTLTEWSPTPIPLLIQKKYRISSRMIVSS
jgi:SRSO17 transposase